MHATAFAVVRRRRSRRRGRGCTCRGAIERCAALRRARRQCVLPRLRSCAVRCVGCWFGSAHSYWLSQVAKLSEVVSAPKKNLNDCPPPPLPPPMVMPRLSLGTAAAEARGSLATAKRQSAVGDFPVAPMPRRFGAATSLGRDVVSVADQVLRTRIGDTWHALQVWRCAQLCRTNGLLEPTVLSHSVGLVG